MRLENDWLPETRSLLDSLVAAGFTLLGGNDGADENVSSSDPAFLADYLTGVDEALLYVCHPTRLKRLVLLLVYGNSPGELVCDYTDNPELEAVVDAHADKWSSIPQPTKQATV